MKIFYSGIGSPHSNPEFVLGDKSNLMLTFEDMRKKPNSRFKKILAVRKRRKKENRK